jgi:hypothetical protein
VCDVPLGTFWKLHGLTLTILINSIKDLSAAAISPHMNFLLALDQLSPCHDKWLQQQAAVSPDHFACEAFCCSGITDQFPCLLTGAVPPSVFCVVALSPLMDMRCLHAWRLLINSLQSNSKAKEDIPHICLFLEQAIACVDTDACLGVVVMPPELTPNFAFYFCMLHGGLPANDTSPFADFMHSKVVCQIA